MGRDICQVLVRAVEGVSGCIGNTEDDVHVLRVAAGGGGFPGLGVRAAHEGDVGQGAGGGTGRVGFEQEPRDVCGVVGGPGLQDFAGDGTAVTPRPGRACGVYTYLLVGFGIEESCRRLFKDPGETAVLSGAVVGLNAMTFDGVTNMGSCRRQGRVCCLLWGKESEQCERKDHIPSNFLSVQTLKSMGQGPDFEATAATQYRCRLRCGSGVSGCCSRGSI